MLYTPTFHQMLHTDIITYVQSWYFLVSCSQTTFLTLGQDKNDLVNAV